MLVERHYSVKIAAFDYHRCLSLFPKVSLAAKWLLTKHLKCLFVILIRAISSMQCVDRCAAPNRLALNHCLQPVVGILLNAPALPTITKKLEWNQTTTLPEDFALLLMLRIEVRCIIQYLRRIAMLDVRMQMKNLMRPVFQRVPIQT